MHIFGNTQFNKMFLLVHFLSVKMLHLLYQHFRLLDTILLLVILVYFIMQTQVCKRKQHSFLGNFSQCSFSGVNLSTQNFTFVPGSSFSAYKSSFEFLTPATIHLPCELLIFGFTFTATSENFNLIISDANYYFISGEWEYVDTLSIRYNVTTTSGTTTYVKEQNILLVLTFLAHRQQMGSYSQENPGIITSFLCRELNHISCTPL